MSYYGLSNVYKIEYKNLVNEYYDGNNLKDILDEVFSLKLYFNSAFLPLIYSYSLNFPSPFLSPLHQSCREPL